ncbi:MAG TPA: nuclear transport factor 2 family protein [Thermohalobaculum sp.]|nr:nuclear transport factor 2 family protein [Thermohalobaculum sp.]
MTRMRETAAVLDANEAFYRAMRTGDLDAMEALWARGRAVSCTHPSGPEIFGRAAVMESWRLILGHAAPDIRAEAPQVLVTGRSAMVLCEEVIGHARLIASNAYVREDGAWRMVTHQAAHVPELDAG